ncbi:MAG: hypothetical protein NTV01_08650, partial [Bacteroidia bacterium]|nr:hypothetical protein [Bacteroidia bacterium]
TGVQGICPSGWHLPDDTEWMAMEKYLGMSDNQLDKIGYRSSGSVDSKLKAIEGWNDDDVFTGQSGFNIRRGGAYSKVERFMGINTSALLWAYTDEPGVMVYRSFYDGIPGISRGKVAVHKAAISVRCIKD